MKKKTVAIGAVLLCSVTALAQSSMEKGQMGKDKMMKDGTVMATGCVAQGSDASHYKLTNAMMSSSMPMDKMGSDPAMKKPEMSGDHVMMWYELDGGSLKAHLGHKVEVTGTMDKSKMDHEKMGKMDDKDKMDKDKMGMSQKDMMGGKIKVKSVKMIAETCM